MTTFGKRSSQVSAGGFPRKAAVSLVTPPKRGMADQPLQMAPDTEAHSATDTSTVLVRWLAVLLLAIVVALLTSYAWHNILKVPAERPFAGLFTDTKQAVGWAPQWVSPLVAALVVLVLVGGLVRRKIVFSLASWAILGGLLGCASLAIAHVVRNAGYVLLFVPGASVWNLIGVLPPMIISHMVGSLQTIVLERHWLLPMAGLLTGVTSWALCRFSIHEQQPPNSTTEMEPPVAERRASSAARTVSSVIYGIGTMQLFAPLIGAASLLCAPIAGYLWWSKVLPDGSFSYSRAMALGSVIPPAVALLPVLMTAGTQFSSDFALAVIVGSLPGSLIISTVVASVVGRRATIPTNG